MRIVENPILEATSKVILRTTRPEFAGAVGVLLRLGDVTCGALISDVAPGDDVVEADKYLRLHLRAANDEQVDVNATEFGAATAVSVLAPPPWNTEGGLEILRSFIGPRPVCAGQRLGIATLSGAMKTIEIETVDGPPVAQISTQTALHVGTHAPTRTGANGTTYQDIGGLGDVLQRIRELIEYPLRCPEVFDHLGITVPRGVILHGPPGTGKTLIAKALCNEVGATFLTIQGPEVISAYYGESERNLRSIFGEAREKQPAVIVIDELDALTPHRGRTRGDLEPRLVAQLLSLMDGLQDLRGVVVIGTTNRLDAIDPALRRPGRFEHEIDVGVPNRDGRREILAIHLNRMRLAGEIELDELAARTSGFVGADLASLCQAAGYGALRRIATPEDWQHGRLAGGVSVAVSAADFEAALKTVSPSALREVVVEAPRGVTWDDVGGVDRAQTLVRENIVEPLRHPERFSRAGVRPPHGVLLYGPPGTGKTLIAEAVANEAGASFIPVCSPDLRARWLMRGEEPIHTLFQKARQVAPCIIFFDEVEAIAGARNASTPQLDAMVGQLLSDMDALRPETGVLVLAATNMASLLDPALLRPGRFDCQIEVPLPPDDEARAAILRIHTRLHNLDPEVDLLAFAALTTGMSGAELAEVCRQAGMLALREGLSAGDEAVVRVAPEHLNEALVMVKHARNAHRSSIGFALGGGPPNAPPQM